MPRQQPRDRRRALLDAALQIARDHGLEALSGPGLAVAAGTSKALVFHYFGSVHGLRVAALAEAADGLLAAVGPVQPDGRRPQRDEAVVVLDRVLAHVEERSGLWLSVWRGNVIGEADAREVLDAARSRIAARMAGVVQGGGPGQLLRVRGWIALVEEVAATWLEGRAAPMTRSAVAELLADTLWQLLPGES